MRDKLITDLMLEVFGPRNGAEEKLKINDNPFKEYITGVIVPQKYRKPQENPDSEITVIGGENYSADDDDTEDEILAMTPSELDPKMRPKSFGLSFVVEGGTPTFKICVTWGRYVRIKDDDVWIRKPYRALKEISLDKDNQRLTIHDEDDGEIFLSFRRIQHSGGRSTVISTLVNNLDVGKGYGDDLTESSLFQPSMRIKLEKDTRIYPMPTGCVGDKTLHYLYRDKPVLARGFMCSAIWNDIDYSEMVDNELFWADGYHFTDCKDFINCDVRSEFVPLCPNPAPIFDLDDESNPELYARNLSEMWDPDEIEKNLSPLIESYSRWVEKNQKEYEKSVSEEKLVIRDIIESQKKTVERLRSGIDLLKENEDVRLAFCFANRVIWLKNSWKSNGEYDFKWRPFQLAFYLMTLESVYNPESEYRNAIDLLWIPTGGGKTEAYFALMAFTMALRRRKAKQSEKGELCGSGISIITRYTLRLLTVQQFRRTLEMVTAAEYLRVSGNAGSQGWRPEKCDIQEDMLYGTVRFSVGMWVGGTVSPNHLRGRGYAIDVLKGDDGSGDPAQIIKCPTCRAWIAIPKSGLPQGNNTVHIVVSSEKTPDELRKEIISHLGEIKSLIDVSVTERDHQEGYRTLSLHVESDEKITGKKLEVVFEQIKKITEVSVASFRASRPGYFGYGNEPGRQRDDPVNFEIYCTNPECELNNHVEHVEGVPLNMGDTAGDRLPDGLFRRIIETPFSAGKRIPIPAYTVDEQIYHRCPTIIVSTADKIARLAFEPRAASLFGNVEGYNAYYGFHRRELFPPKQQTTVKARKCNVECGPFLPPDLIVQDELHLMEGPLGCMFGLYECVVEGLIASAGAKVKYIASTATIKNADKQVKSLFTRDLYQFPPYGLSIDDNFFVKTPGPEYAWNEDRAGRIYMGVYAPAMGPLTPNIRIWSTLLKTCFENQDDEAMKHYWTIVGYYNAIRELGGGIALYREDIVERLKYKSSGTHRTLDPGKVVELSSRVNSTNIPLILDELEGGGERGLDENSDAIFTTSMFGTGVDIPHLSLMVVNGQPKTTSQYIQATGRVGRSHGGLIVTFLRAGRPRDLSHYEMFSSYHHRVYLDVEPSSVSPFSEGCMRRASGPAMVSFLRNMPSPSVDWFGRDGTIIGDDSAAADIEKFKNDILLPRLRHVLGAAATEKIKDFEGYINRWETLARSVNEMDFVEYCMYGRPQKNVVLGDPPHEHSQLVRVYKNAPQSLREIEETTGFEV